MGFNMRSKGGFLKQIGTLYASYTTYQIQNRFLHSTMAKALSLSSAHTPLNCNLNFPLILLGLWNKGCQRLNIGVLIFKIL